MTKSPPQRILELDGVRGIASLFVLIFHLAPAVQDTQNWLLHSVLFTALFGGTEFSTFPVAKLSWKYFEQPLINYNHRFRYKMPAQDARLNLSSVQAQSLPQFR
jgi:peptidoglycan/LPS O-acetylase OafA/YrhL